jgi:alpha-L-arabinofuranosidase
MRKSLSLLLAAACCGALAAAEPQVRLSVDVGETGKAISPDLFGIFFEDINYAADGGLYGELVQNRSFEYNASENSTWNELNCWQTVTRGAGVGRVQVRTAKPIAVQNPHYVSIDVEVAGEGYTYSFFAHQLFMGKPWTPDNDVVGRPMPVLMRLETESGEVLAEAATNVEGREWKRYAARLVPMRSADKARLVLLARAQGGIGVDEVSLFPEKTFHGRPNGLRADLAQVIADMKPRFIRFPGGCLAHGDGVNNIYRWKDTIGPVELRKGQRNIWGYHQSVGLGYFEYFQFCEDIGATPLPVLAAAVSCQNSDYSPGFGQQAIPMEQMGAYIQEILDLIEWANGPVDSAWGAKRAAAGHPGSFHLRYIGIGNEDRITPEFEARFAMIQKAIREKHPEVLIVGTAGPFPNGEDFDKGWAFARKQGVDLVDEHYYMPPEWFWDNLSRYDAYDRKGPKVYAGEYAAHERNRRNTLRTALAEAAACTSYERNGDVVWLASYAPLLSRLQHTQWTPDAIYFTGTEVYPSANYYVQKLFAGNAGDRWLAPVVEGVKAGERLAVSSVRDSRSGDVILKLVNGGDTARTVQVSLRGLGAVRCKAELTAFGGTSPDAVNENGQPPVLIPTTSTRQVGASFEQEVAANSLLVIRISR